MIIAALHQVGGVDHLAARAQDQPVALIALLGKVLPLAVQNQHKPVEEMTDDELETTWGGRSETVHASLRGLFARRRKR